MKILLLIVFSASSILCIAQKHPFVRVFNLVNHKKITGRLNVISDSSITVGEKVIKYNDISIIRTKRSFGHSVLTFTYSFVGIGILAGVISDLKDGSSGYGLGFIVGGVLGLYMGIPTGLIAGTVKNTHKFTVNGNLEDWLKVKQLLLK